MDDLQKLDSILTADLESPRDRWESRGDVARRTRDTSDLWETRETRQVVRNATAEFLADLQPWRSFLTLTFREPREPDVADRYFRRLVQVLNTDAFGKRYVRKVGHSYFGYLVAREYQRRDVIHFHALTSQPVNFDRVHAYWNAVAGFAWCEPVKSLSDVIAYCAKYCVKAGGWPEVYQPTTTKIPLIGTLPPMWWPS